MKQYKNKEQEKMDQVNEAAVAYGVVDNNNVFLLINSIKRGIGFSAFKKHCR